jgi:prepilin-type N-terminal cleavage/methylation domain-containing protein
LARVAPARGFTLVELIVAVAVVALLSLGIGQLFTNVQKLVGSGAAVAESDQFARALGAQLRDDFEALSQMSSGETFIAIRNRRLGDTNGDGDADDAGERPVYLSADDRERDLRAGIDPYANGSRAVTVRLDELMFLAPGKGGAAHTSAQTVGAGGGNLPTATIARIYYGHGLRPAVDRTFDPLNPPNNAESNVPPRQWVADGDFAQRAGENNNRFDPDDVINGGQVSGRNEYASQWMLLRQPLLLYGGTASGYPLGGGGSAVSSPFDPQLSYTPYIRPLESHGDVRPYWGNSGWDISDDNPTPRPANVTGPFPRLMRHGRVDVCAQSPEDVRRWLQGLAPLPPSNLNTGDIDATAFSTGRLESLGQQVWVPGSETDTQPNLKADAPIFRRVNIADFELAPLANRRSLIGAIAGCFTRFLADTNPPLLDRGDTLSLDSSDEDRDQGQNSDPAASAFMDTHAVLGAHVSSFEVAWTDGKTWEKDDPLDRNGDGQEDPTDPRRGDEIYYDIDFTRDSRDSTRGDATKSLFAQANNGRLYGMANPDLATVGNQQIVREVAMFPEVPPEMRNDPTQGLVSSAARMPPPTGPGLGFGGYNPGDDNLPGANAGDPTDDGEHEYLAIFPYRWASGETDGELDSRPAAKPKRIRIRVLVHDSQLRLSPGSIYEFIFPVNLREP